MAQPETHDHDQSAFRAHLPDLSSPRFVAMRSQDPYEYAQAFRDQQSPPWLHALYTHWQALLAEPFKGITSDGVVRPGLFQLEDQGVPIDDIVAAARHAVAQMDETQRQRTHYHIDSAEWRTWSNPEFLLSDKGIRLDEVSGGLREAVMQVLRASLSPEGYDKAVAAMRINGFLGELVEAPAIMNEFSYNFVLFGDEPSTAKPWGFSFYGHHLCLSAFFYKSQMVLSPCFTGAEPNVIDAGPNEGTKILQAEEALGLRLMRSLTPEQQRRAQTYAKLKDPAMPHGRWNHDDQRHLCGAFRDNRVVPYEGVCVANLEPSLQRLASDVLAQYLLYLPARAREMRLVQAREWFHETYFSWIGGFADGDAFYYRIQSPVIVVEFDHHSGVFLTNKEPARFHTHTILRTPNAGDYGMALRPLIPGVEQDFVWEGQR
ncbi:GTP binding protein and negative regulator of the Ran/Tc4 GTPase cycle, Gtr1p [Purpureocillium lavendulum]|uniref:GTP binding protein and negative regulator of the Ran/Tc4 GTPase cycle, Gtr1p n=1 Tax=Purpureocillium lavendulum TaxID=1247861 RepID=A0AB34FVY8_9HYPO|nr:GTP binding protein and negative regulator of the Ran/Tc4 GTPase cycle, Gtr1p [Purpureocillium lavendulum]